MEDVRCVDHNSCGQRNTGPAGGAADERIAALADAQHGVVARRQLIERGLSRRQIEHRLRTRRLRLLHRGVYAVGHSRLPPRGRAMAAVLAAGPGALLSHQSAAGLWGLVRDGRARIDVTVVGAPRTRRGIAIHRARAIDPRDRAIVDGIPATSVPRTLLDLAEVLPAARLERAIEEAERLRLLDLRALADAPQRWPGRRGLEPLLAALARLRPLAETRSELERRFLRLCRDAGLPQPATNVAVAGYEVDALWSDARLVVELDGHAFHSSRAAFERDRVRDAELQLAGYRVLRVTHRRLAEEPAALADAVGRLLGRAG